MPQSSRRLMVFVDGSNLLIGLAEDIGVGFRADNPPEPAIKLAADLVREQYHSKLRSTYILIRQYWFGSYQGGDKMHTELRHCLRTNGFEPVLFKQFKGKAEKSVDIALTTRFLVDAFNQNFDVALLVSGDEDYLGVVNEVKRYGAIVHGSFFKNGLSEELQLAFDDFRYLGLGQLVTAAKKQSYIGEIQSAITKSSKKD